MTVYIVEMGEYEQSGIMGVYASPEAAMRAWPVPESVPSFAVRLPGGWQRDQDGWTNGLCSGYGADIFTYEVQE